MKLHFVFFTFSLFFGMCSSEDAAVQTTDEFPQLLKSNSRDSIPLPPVISPPLEDDIILFTPTRRLPSFYGCEHIQNYEERNKCTNEKIIGFINKYLKYPEEAKKDSIEGTVVVRFTIEADSSMSFDKDVSKTILRDIGGGCAEELIRVLKRMPQFSPVEKNGKSIATQMTIPAKFLLKNHINRIELPKAGCRGDVPEKHPTIPPHFAGCENIYNDIQRKKCSDEKIVSFINRNFKYPKKARDSNIEGTTVIRFIVEKDGSLGNYKILRDPGGGHGEEALRVLKLMPNWIPGRYQGEVVSSFFTLPIKIFPAEENKKKLPIPSPPPPPKLPVYNENIPRIVESMPRFPGCEVLLDMDERKKCSDEKRLEFINRNLKYPRTAGCIEGTTVIRFIVEKDGSRSNYEILRNPGGGLGEEALRVLKKMPKWIPGRHEGKTTRVYFTMPVRFEVTD